MKIASYNLKSGSSHKLEKSKEVTEKTDSWVGKKQNANSLKEEPSFLIDFGFNKKVFEYTTEKSYLSDVKTDEIKDQTSQVKLKLIESFIYMTTGKRVKLRSPELGAVRREEPVISDPDAVMRSADDRDGWGLVYEYHEVSTEQESVFFNSAGLVKTSNGTTITFELDFNMSRSFYQQHNVSLRLGDAAKMDPLIIALNGNVPELSKNKVAFDLNSDGKDENISFATGSSGFLALDKNEDGVINDGTELFGPDSKDGFAELRTYDLDKNGWIDEGDEIFTHLAIYSLSENGDKSLFKLGDAGIGAIYLTEISTPFSFKDNTGAIQGEMLSSTIFLKEDGTAGTIHHIDLTI